MSCEKPPFRTSEDRDNRAAPTHTGGKWWGSARGTKAKHEGSVNLLKKQLKSH